MKPPAPTRRDRLRAMLADLKMPGGVGAAVHLKGRVIGDRAASS